MSLKHLLITVAVCLYLHAPAQQEQYTFSRVDVASGLSHNQVNTILRDRNGFLWFGTMSGLNRYDGYSVKTYRSTADSNTLTDNYISNIWECPGNKLWINSRSDGCLFDLGTERFDRNGNRYLQSLGMPAGTVSAIRKDSKGQYWFIIESKGLYRVSPGQKAGILVYPFPAAAASDSAITQLAEDSFGYIWLVHRSGLLTIMEPSSLQIVHRNTKLQQANKGNYPYQLFIDKDNGLWAWTGDPKGVFYLDPAGSLRILNENSQPHRLNNNLVNGIAQDKSGLIWIATDHGGINLVNKEGFTIRYLVNDPENNKSLAQNSINALYRDPNGIIWIGTYKQGVSYINENISKFAHYKHRASDRRSLPYDDVNRFVEDARGNLWIGTNGGGLLYFDRQQNSFRQYLHNPNDPSSLSNNVVVSLCLDHEQKLWIGTYLGGLNCFDGNRFIHYRHNEADPGSLAEDRVWEILEDAQHQLWVGTLGRGLDRFDRSTGQFIHYRDTGTTPAATQAGFIMALQEDRQGNLWIGTAGGMDLLNKKTGQLTRYSHSADSGSLSNNNVLSILEDAFGRIWVGTREGLNLFEPASSSFRHFTREQGLPDNTILTILEDQQHNLWITTPSGLSNLLLKKDSEGRTNIADIRNYDETSNLQGREFNENAALRTRKGELVVGGPNGFNIITAGYTHPVQENPPIVFTSFQVFNKNINAGDRVNDRVILSRAITETDAITLRFKDNVFSIEYAALDFVHSNGDRYAYKLEGFNKDWLYTDGSQRRATYTNLDPGTYHFKVKALNPEGNWSPEKELTITILPPFWRTPIAIIIYILVVAGILVLARRITVERTRMRYEMEQQRREADRMHAIDSMKTKFFTNVSHEFRTPLSLILSPLDRILKSTHDAQQRTQLQLIQRNAKRLLHLINQLLDFRKMEVQQFVLHPTQSDIIRFVRDISYSFSDIAEQKNISFSVESARESLDMCFDRDKLEKILFNLLSNAFKYTPNNGRVSVYLRCPDEQHIEIRVKDTGIGIPADKHDRIFERFFQHDVPEGMISQGTGIGLAITKEFVRLHEGSVQVESEPDKGTSFIVVLPVRKNGELQALPPTAPTPAPSMSLEPLPAAGTEIAPGSSQKQKSRTILVVEDNEDFRFYLKDNLNRKYQVLEAADGKTGWQKAKEFLPDLVVSDIMMPQLSGIELLRRIKGDPRTAQIPVILLTAMDSEETQLEGYKTGVNDYIAKPFTFEILETRIRNLLAQQQQLKKNIERQREVNPETIAIESADDRFLKMAREAVEKNIGNPDYSVEDLSRDLFMSRVAAYKKILALTRLTPVEFIRHLRLKRAAQLLAQSQLTVAQVAYEVGFNNPKNFARYFKEAFQVLPSQYQKDPPRASPTEAEA
ncbi:MAG: two-component regulator propeller domain-containing protein [Candidatus Pseudobacter hemicellulosilyticus]|uniref:histidine kinase n=1 Tax=Candidatus Pseudobacter hemicellulosilyticus TaxID=3121375 RepID=A0AAJ6BGM8_9BACT|nr:MAG: two-component regulator propeller domain-containing protein [Pseudobacter sp.]